MYYAVVEQMLAGKVPPASQSRCGLGWVSFKLLWTWMFVLQSCLDLAGQLLGCGGAVQSPVPSGFSKRRADPRFTDTTLFKRLNLRMLIVVVDQDEELGSNEGLEKSKERAVCNKIYFTTLLSRQLSSLL